jgi:hypothetical protein
MSCEVRARLQFNDVQVDRWREEQVGMSDDEKKFLMGMVMVDRNTTPSSGCCFHATSGFVHDFV